MDAVSDVDARERTEVSVYIEGGANTNMGQSGIEACEVIFVNSSTVSVFLCEH